jgi:pimeloyl-ACP methyl ester carboxylesterase
MTSLDVYAAPQTLVDIGGGRRINVHRTGTGSPTVILAPGLGGTTLSWAGTQRRLSALTEVIAYDRAGFGFSDPGPLPRTADAIHSDLRAMIKALDLRPPYILAGHSAGSYDVRMYASRYPDEVAGLVLVDPSSEEQTERFRVASEDFDKLNVMAAAMYRRCGEAAAAGKLKRDNPEYADCFALGYPDLSEPLTNAYKNMRLAPGLWQAWESEMASFGSESVPQMRAVRRPLGDIPLIVLTAKNIQMGPVKLPDDMDTKLRTIWFALHADLASLSTKGDRRMIESGHNIQVEHPQLVADAIAEVVQMARAT